MDVELYKACRDAVETALDEGQRTDVIFDRFCDAAETYAKKYREQAYCRVFWHDETDLDEAISDVLYMAIHKGGTGFATVESGDLCATFVAITFAEQPNTNKTEV